MFYILFIVVSTRGFPTKGMACSLEYLTMVKVQRKKSNRLEYRSTDKVPKRNSNSWCYTRSSEPFTIYYVTYLRFEVFTAVVINVAIFWDISPCSPYVNRRFGKSNISIFRVENQPSKKPAFSRLSRQNTIFHSFLFKQHLHMSFVALNFCTARSNGNEFSVALCFIQRMFWEETWLWVSERHFTLTWVCMFSLSPSLPFPRLFIDNSVHKTSM
jgi:hypothetical protein